MDHALLQKILDITVEIANEKDHLVLLNKILTESMSISNCDAGTLYIQKDGRLEFALMRTISLNIFKGVGGEKIDLPPVEINESSVAGYCAVTRQIVRIDDVYNDPEFIWDGPKIYDKKTGYHTQSLLVLPLVDKSDELIGVLQLLNAADPETGKIVPFDDEIGQVILSLGCQSAVILSNMLLLQNIKGLLDSFVEAMTTAIDSRTPYNANHTKRVAKLCKDFSEYLDSNSLVFMNKYVREELEMAAMLHDVGKMAVPIHTLNKASRLEGRIDLIEIRCKLIEAELRISFLEGKITEEEYVKEIEYLEDALTFIEGINVPCVVTEEKYQRLCEIHEKEYKSENGILKILTDEDFQNASIRRGTLTEEERKEIENHVVYTSRILARIDFGEKYKHVPFIAGAHHEYMNGTGYPNGLSANKLPVPVRVITIMDVFESLTSADRPYKKPMSKEKALNVLSEMVDEGKLDGELVGYFTEYVKSQMGISG